MMGQMTAEAALARSAARLRWAVKDRDGVMRNPRYLNMETSLRRTPLTRISIGRVRVPSFLRTSMTSILARLHERE
jgi:hypothetical protein